MRICLFEDAHVADLEPLVLTRPVFELRCGLTTLAQKQCRYFGASAPGAQVRPRLAPLYTIQHPSTPVNDPDWLRAGPVVLVNGRWLPPRTALHPDVQATMPSVGIIGDEIAYVVLWPDQFSGDLSKPIDECVAECGRTLPSHPAGGQIVRYLWELIDWNAREIAADFAVMRLAEPPGRPGTLTLVGPSDWLHIDPTARIDPFVVADTSNGPVVIDRDAVVTSFTRLEGPCHVGPRSQLFRANVRSGTSLGPNCRVGGEVECSILQGNTNKYHDGFLGHSYLGEWVNLGAGAQASDLRNDYGEIHVTVNGAKVATGRSKVGAFIGDHTKIGLGALLNTGSSFGVCCQLLPNGQLLPS